MENLENKYLSNLEMNEISGGLIRFSSFPLLFLAIDAINAFAEGAEESYSEKCECDNS